MSIPSSVPYLACPSGPFATPAWPFVGDHLPTKSACPLIVPRAICRQSRPVALLFRSISALHLPLPSRHPSQDPSGESRKTAEGATRPETLRQKDGGVTWWALESGRRRAGAQSTHRRGEARPSRALLAGTPARRPISQVARTEGRQVFFAGGVPPFFMPGIWGLLLRCRDL